MFRNWYFTSSPAIIPGCMWNKDRPKEKVIIKDSWNTDKKAAGGSWKWRHAELSSHPPSIVWISGESYSARGAVTGELFWTQHLNTFHLIWGNSTLWKGLRQINGSANSASLRGSGHYYRAQGWFCLLTELNPGREEETIQWLTPKAHHWWTAILNKKIHSPLNQLLHLGGQSLDLQSIQCLRQPAVGKM